VKRTGGIVLCGGQSKRMARPKAWLPFAGETMLERVVRLLQEVVDPIVVVAAPGQDIPVLPANVSLTRDEVQGRGPLQGIAAGLTALSPRVDAAYVTSCDVPFLQSAFVRRMIELLGDRMICMPYVNGYHHPLAAVYRIEVVEAVKKLLSENRLSVTSLLEEVPTRFVSESEIADVDPTFQTLRNLNTPEEYELALRDAGLNPETRPLPDSE
jgi:molybdopterin-guanine dinucleotide biosynthesis protein A